MRRALAPLVAVVAIALLAAPVAGKTDGVAYQCEEFAYALVDGGRSWESDGVGHLRGQVVVMLSVGDDFCAGLQTTVVSYNLNLATSTGTLWGTGVLETSAFDGGYTSSWHATFTAPDPMAPDAQDIWLGQYVRHGFGELEGWQARGTILEKLHYYVLEDGFAFEPGS